MFRQCPACGHRFDSSSHLTGACPRCGGSVASAATPSGPPPVGDEFFPQAAPAASVWRIIGFIAALLALVGVVSIATRGRGADSAGILPYDCLLYTSPSPRDS
ncbi:MAG: hypothetical protein QUU85_11415, partial [Candidatus Eisenbacteria bacterium]|nr:hypothetical protein [Candidatus Eisenbacteria bacterium]